MIYHFSMISSRSYSKDNVTLLHLADVYRGLNHAKIRKFRHAEVHGYGYGKEYVKSDIDRILRHLISVGILGEIFSKSIAGFIVAHVTLGKNAYKYKEGRNITIQDRVKFQFEESSRKPPEKKRVKDKKEVLKDKSIQKSKR